MTTAEQKELTERLVRRVQGDLTTGDSVENGMAAFSKGAAYASSGRFDNSRYYHSYRILLDDGTTVTSTVFFRNFTVRNQTHAYMEAETILTEFFPEQKDALFHLLREQRAGITGVFKAVLMPKEPQRFGYTDFLLSIVCFGAGYCSARRTGV